MLSMSIIKDWTLINFHCLHPSRLITFAIRISFWYPVAVQRLLFAELHMEITVGHTDY